MKNVLKFLIFILYATVIFLLPNHPLIFILLPIHLIIIIFAKLKWKMIIKSTCKILPFIFFTFIINCILDELINAFWVGIKLLIVCNITIIYSQTTSITRYCRNNPTFM
mgnify:CR=1 FL=1